MKLPKRVQTPRLVLRHWKEADVDDLAAAIEESLEDLRPWMPWALEEPKTRDERLAMFREWHESWAEGNDSVLGILWEHRIIGGAGLHRRGRPDELEIGYWVRSGHTGQGFATETARALTTAAFEIPDVEIASVHHDRGNRASAAIPKKLGFRMVREVEYEPVTSGCSGVEWQWEVSRARWNELSAAGI